MSTHQTKLSERKSCCPDKKAAPSCCYMHCFSTVLMERVHRPQSLLPGKLLSAASRVPSNFVLFLLTADQVGSSGCGCPGGKTGMSPRPAPGRQKGTAPFSLSQAHISPVLCLSKYLLSHGKALCYCRRSTTLTHLASLELLLSICSHLWQGMCWCPAVAQQNLFPGSWITGMWRTAQWNSGRHMFGMLACLFGFSSQPIKLSSIIFLLKAWEKRAESCVLPWQFSRTESNWQVTGQ